MLVGCLSLKRKIRQFVSDSNQNNVTRPPKPAQQTTSGPVGWTKRVSSQSLSLSLAHTPSQSSCRVQSIRLFVSRAAENLATYERIHRTQRWLGVKSSPTMAIIRWAFDIRRENTIDALSESRSVQEVAELGHWRRQRSNYVDSVYDFGRFMKGELPTGSGALYAANR